MAAPSFIQEAETAWFPQAGGTKSTPARDYVAGDVLVAFGAGEDGSTVTALAFTGLGLTWTPPVQSNIQAASCTGYLWAAVDDGDLAAQATVTPTLPSGNKAYGCNLLTFRNSDGIGASAKATVAVGAPTLDITTTQDNSAIVVLCVDWNASSATGRAWRTGAGAITEVTVDDSSAGAAYTVFGGYHADAGATGLKTVGMTLPSGQKYTLMAVEVKGTAGAASPPAVVSRSEFEPTRFGPF